MKLDIEPRDITEKTRHEFLLRPDVLARLEAYAKSKNDEPPYNYTLEKILDAVLPGAAKKKAASKPSTASKARKLEAA